jgi:hypothetical protein
LFWFATYHASAALAPWLNDKTVYRLIRWPDFGRVRAADAGLRTAQIRIVAALDVGATTINKLAGRAQASIDQTTRTMNALDSCALVDVAQATIAAKTVRTENSAPEPVGGFKKFLRNMRKHLLGVPS